VIRLLSDCTEKVEMLVLQNCDLSEEEILGLAKMLKQKLTKPVSWCLTRIRLIPKYTKLKNFTKMELLDISHNALTPLGVSHLTKSLQNINVLSLATCKLSSKDVKGLAKEIAMSGKRVRMDGHEHFLLFVLKFVLRV